MTKTVIAGFPHSNQCHYEVWLKLVNERPRGLNHVNAVLGLLADQDICRFMVNGTVAEVIYLQSGENCLNLADHQKNQ